MSAENRPIKGDEIEYVRSFNRFYTKQIGVLHEGLLNSPYSLVQARIIYELASREGPTASELAKELGLDQSYLSRTIKGFLRKGIVERTPCDRDGRQFRLYLTRAGREDFNILNTTSRKEVGEMLSSVAKADRARLIAAMSDIREILDADNAPARSYLIRPHRPGDIGWVISRHGEIYANEYGWDISFEAMVAEIAAEFVKNFDPQWENCWIAELDGQQVGSVFIVRKSDTVAKLRMLIVDPKGRGLGIGKRLVEETIRFCRQKGYSKITLWTNDILTAARHIYETLGFELVASEPHHSFGVDLIGETWELDL